MASMGAKLGWVKKVHEIVYMASLGAKLGWCKVHEIVYLPWHLSELEGASHFVPSGKNLYQYIPSMAYSTAARTFRNVDWQRTIHGSLDRWDPQQQQLAIDRVHYRHRQRGHGTWRIILAVDQSGSMLDSVIHAAVMGAIFASLPVVVLMFVVRSSVYSVSMPLQQQRRLPAASRSGCRSSTGQSWSSRPSRPSSRTAPPPS